MSIIFTDSEKEWIDFDVFDKPVVDQNAPKNILIKIEAKLKVLASFKRKMKIGDIY